MTHRAIAVAYLLFALLAGRQAAAADRPNFLFIYTDDQRWDAMGVVQQERGEEGRFPFLKSKTPNYDRLAAEGMRFRNAFVMNSLCAPSRANFLTGQYSHLNGVANNHTDFPVDSVTWSTELRKHGYTTGYFGKWHMGKQSGQRPGFDYSASFVGQGRYVDCPIEVNGKETRSKGWVDDVTTEYLINWLRQNKEKPFGAVMGYKASHGPWDPPERRKDDLADAVSRPPPNADAVPPYKQGASPDGARKKGKKKSQARADEFAPLFPVIAADKAPAKAPAQAAAPGNNDRAAMQRNYFRTLLAIDDNVGKILAALDELKLADKTVVVFSSDNGYYLGDHGLGDKRTAYDESMRIPMLVRYPGVVKPGSTCDAMVLNVDLAPTFLDLACVAVPQSMQGRSWKPLLQGSVPDDWRKAFFYEYFFERGFAAPTTLAVRTDDAKLITYPGHDDWTELYDLKADPYEKNNLYGKPDAAELQKRMEAEFEKQKQAVDFKIPDYADDPAAASAADGSARTATGPVLSYDFTRPIEGKTVVDASPASANGTLTNVKQVEGRDGKSAMRFDGGHIEVPRLPALNPANGPWTVEATFRADSDGVVLAHGGASHGYALLVKGGKPVFVVTVSNRTTRVEGAAVSGRWATVTARITPDQQAVLSVDGKEAARRKLPGFIPSLPNDGLQIGADLKSPVIENAPPFKGMIESVHLRAE